MKNYKLIFAIIVIISILIFYFSPTLESFRGRRGGYIVNRRGMHGRGGWPGHYLDHFRRRNNGYYKVVVAAIMEVVIAIIEVVHFGTVCF